MSAGKTHDSGKRPLLKGPLVVKAKKEITSASQNLQFDTGEASQAGTTGMAGIFTTSLVDAVLNTNSACFQLK